MASDRAAAEEQPEKQIGEMMQKLKIGSVPAPEPAATEEKASANGKKVSAPDGTTSEPTSSVTSLGDSGSTKGSEVEQESMGEQGVYYPSNNYYGVVYPGYDVMGNEWDEHGGIVGVDGMEYPYTGVQAENGSLVYYMPSYSYPQPAYNPYNPYIPGAVYGMDGQFLAHQPYYGGPIYQQPFTPPAYYQPPVAYGSEVPPAFPWDSGLVVGPNGNGINPGTPPGVSRTSNSLPAAPLNVPYSKVAPAGRKSVDSKGSTLISEGLQPPSIPTGGQPASQGTVPSTVPQRSLNKIPHNGSPIQSGVLPKGYVPLGKVVPNQGKATVLYTDHIGDVKVNGHDWLAGERLKMRGRAPNGGLDALNEQNRGPRINKTRNPWPSSADTTAADQEGAGSEVYSPLVKRDQYNLPDFPTKYENALFFVIKSYSEDDVHKSIKYNVWASTPNGNKRLDAAYQAAKEKSGGKPGTSPVFLFFSVNASGQFCGVAEMTGPVDFNKSMNFWQQDKWNGFFPVKWHIIKDVPNSQFRHIILENNDNKPVTNSRDTQEIKFTQGNEMLSIFKNYSLKTSILDDFMFYENRQKTMQDKKRQPYHQEQLLTAGRFDAAQRKGFDEQLDKSDGELKVSAHCDAKAANGTHVSAPILSKHNIEATVVKRDQIVQSNHVDTKRGEAEGIHTGIQKIEQ